MQTMRIDISNEAGREWENERWHVECRFHACRPFGQPCTFDTEDRGEAAEWAWSHVSHRSWLSA